MASGTDRATRSFIAYRIERTHARLTAQATRLLAEACGLTPRQWWIIADIIAETPETAAELTRIADIDKGQLSRNLKQLVEMGLVATKPDPDDHRQQLIEITEKGRHLHADTLPVMTARNARLIADIGEDKLNAALDVLQRIEAAARITKFDADR